MQVAQAVILCGGRGERLRPLTDIKPKPMVDLNGRPFLYFLFEQLAENGIRRFVLLTGYLGEQIVEYFGDGSSWGWSIEYSHGPVEWLTARRVYEAIDQIDQQFLLLYSDNFAQLHLKELHQICSDNQSAITLSVVRKSPGNIQMKVNNLVTSYDLSRSDVGADFVEIGYSLVVKNKIFTHLKKYKSENFSSVIKCLTEANQVTAVIVNSGYQSISDPLRLATTAEHLRYHRILLLDRDGTLNVKPRRGEYVNSVQEFRWIESSQEALKTLGQRGFSFIIISNQAGVATGATTPENLKEINEYVRSEFLNLGLRLLDIYVCTDHWSNQSQFRKPNPGMFFAAARDHNFRLDHSIYVGDDDRDALAAENAGCKCVLVTQENIDAESRSRVVSIGKSLTDLVPTIIDKYETWGN